MNNFDFSRNVAKFNPLSVEVKARDHLRRMMMDSRYRVESTKILSMLLNYYQHSMLNRLPLTSGICKFCKINNEDDIYHQFKVGTYFFRCLVCFFYLFYSKLYFIHFELNVMLLMHPYNGGSIFSVSLLVNSLAL